MYLSGRFDLIFSQLKNLPLNLDLLKIIIADDDLDDRMLLIEVLEKNGIERDKFVIASDGVELVTLLPQYSKTPTLVFLDLNMPSMNGLRALGEIKANPSLKHIPILVFTTSRSSEDIQSSYNLGAATFFTKPDTYTEMIELGVVVKDYWLKRATIP